MIRGIVYSDVIAQVLKAPWDYEVSFDACLHWCLRKCGEKSAAHINEQEAQRIIHIMNRESRKAIGR